MARRSIAERNNEEYRQWQLFESQLSRMDSVEEVERFVYHGPSRSQPGAKFYSNLGHLINEHNVPMGATSREKQLYIALLKRFIANNEWRVVSIKLLKDLGVPETK